MKHARLYAICAIIKTFYLWNTMWTKRQRRANERNKSDNDEQAKNEVLSMIIRRNVGICGLCVDMRKCKNHKHNNSRKIHTINGYELATINMVKLSIFCFLRCSLWFRQKKVIMPDLLSVLNYNAVFFFYHVCLFVQNFKRIIYHRKRHANRPSNQFRWQSFESQD